MVASRSAGVRDRYKTRKGVSHGQKKYICGNKDKEKTVLYLDLASNLAGLAVFLGRGGYRIRTRAGAQSLQYFLVDILGESGYRFILMVYGN